MHEEIEVDSFERMNRPRKYENSEFEDRNQHELEGASKDKELRKLRKAREERLDTEEGNL